MGNYLEIGSHQQKNYVQFCSLGNNINGYEVQIWYAHGNVEEK